MQPLYGRAEALGRARAALGRAAQGAGGLLLFTGEPGIGKSKLAERVAGEAQAQGWAVAWGRCWEAGGAPAYWPWLQAFRSLELAEDPFAGGAPELAPGAAELRFAAFERAVRLLQQQARRQPLLLVLDDLHVADAPSLLLLLLLARELARWPLLVLGAYRDAELRSNPELAALLGKLAREAEVFPLTRLSSEDVAVWLRESGAAASAAEASSLYRLTEGHPLLVVEALRLPERGAGFGAAPAPASALLDERLGVLTAQARAVLQVAAVLGRDFTSADVAASGELGLDRVAEALRAALAASLVSVGAELEAFRFSHVLLRDRLYRELLPSVRAELHVRAGAALLARRADALSAVHHFFEGESAAPPEQLAEVALAAAEAALARLAFEDALRVGRRALELGAARQFSERTSCQLELVVAESLFRLGETAQGRQLAARAAERAARAGERELLARAALVNGAELMSGTIDLPMIDLLRQALAQLGERDSPLRARVMARLAAALTPPASYDDGDEILSLMRGAVAMARRLQDRPALLYVLQFGATVAMLVPDTERVAYMLETLELSRALGQRLVELLTLPAFVTALLLGGERERALAELPGYDRLLEEFPQPLHALRRALLNALVTLLEGDREGAVRQSNEARALAQRSASGPAFLLWLAHRLSFAQLLDEPQLVEGDVEAAKDCFSATIGSVPYVSWLLAGAGRRAEAVALLPSAMIEPLEIASANLMPLMGAAESSVRLGDAALARTLHPRLLRAADRSFFNLGPGSILGPTERALGDLALLTEQPALALRHYDEAIASCERLQAPLLVEVCRRRRTLAEAALAGVEAEEKASLHAARAMPSRNERRPPGAELSLRREGDFWTLASSAGALVRLRDSKGVAYLQCLLEQPGRQVHVLELVGIEHRAGDAGAVLDARAKAQYRERLDELREELGQAERAHDSGRAERCEREIEALAEQLAGAVGLGGRDRRAASDVERTRVNVQRRLKDVLERVNAADPELGRYLRATLATGTYCLYQPL